ncbi:DUF2834 domain-containing protein [Pseudomonas sp. RP23018S]|uniref:DUF2834 domain-containing protein n=1 Tax=Pseudomonas sp. RP23018S TaxID=3096037 RepID=UPI002ACA4C79|nr:DUF2834 domain-containing protein [Pseudomonas sp. RP23018S]MDZ5602721.1 DUF2834 domain-containing protein [Pseudomonas sp. RP23018S]
MKLRCIALVALVLFSLYTGWTMLIAEQSLLAFGMALIASPDTAQVVLDLYLMAALAGIWMVRNNHRRGRPWLAVLPYLALTAVFVCIGPLLYIVLNGVQEGRDH